MKDYLVKSVCKEDLTDYLSKEQIEKLKDEDMKYIAEKMSDYLQDAYWDALEEAIDHCLKEEENFCPKCGKIIPTECNMCQSCELERGKK